MASISKESGGRRTIQFVSRDGRRKSLRLGKCDQRTAESIRFRVEKLNAACISGHAPDDETSRWLAERGDDLMARLAKVGLVPEREAAGLASFLDGYVKSRTDVKPTTKSVWKQVTNGLTSHFGAAARLRDIDTAKAETYRDSMIAAGLAVTTVQKRVQFARDFFSVAKRRGLIAENPFTEVKTQSPQTKERTQFVTREQTRRVLEVCPDLEWRGIVALARFGGLRCPSEVFSLRWQDIDWEHGRMSVQAPKGERHGKGVRLVPLFPELREILGELFDAAEPGAVYVIEKNRKPSLKRIDGRENNHRTRFARIVRRAGMEPWPRIFHSLRASRETELVDRFPVQVVTDWLGNTPDVARRHYLLTTEEHFSKALEPDQNQRCRALQNPVQSAHERACTQKQLTESHYEKHGGNRVLPPLTDRCGGTLYSMAEVHGNRTHRRRV
ncbi:MAG: tyrosine-type recombinase/integrase [Pirellulales bacterium]